MYQADALVQLEAKQDNSLLKSLSQFGPEISPDAAPELLLLKSRMVLGATVNKLKLNYQVRQRFLPIVGRLWYRFFSNKPVGLSIDELNIPLLNGKQQELILTVQQHGQYQLLSKSFKVEGAVGKRLVKDGVTLLVTSIDADPGTQFTISEFTQLQAINALQKKLTVMESSKQSGIILLTLTGDAPHKVTEILNTITENYLFQNISREEAQDSRSLSFLQHQIPKVRRELDEAEVRLNAYRAQRDSVDLSLEAKSVLEQVVNVENQLNELTFREAEISQLFKKEHPTYRALSEKRQTLQHERARLNNRISSMPSTQQEIMRLSRDVESGRTIYLQLLTRQQELSISRSSAIGNVRIIDSAVTQPDPIAPKKILIICLGVLLGLIFSVFVVLVRSAFNRGVYSSEQIEEYGVPVLATIPRSHWLWKRTHLRSSFLFSNRWKHKTSDIPFLPFEKPEDIFVEAVRGLRVSLHFTMLDATNRIVMISSPTQDCGKTSISTTLALMAAQAGQRVLFVDADMRIGYAHHIFKLNNNRGLSCILEGKIQLHDAIQSFEKGGFDVLTCGPYPKYPLELLMSEYFNNLLLTLNEKYDIVIVDTPPMLAVTDPLIISRVAATRLLIARFNKTSVKDIKTCLKRMRQVEIEANGVILNDIIKSSVLKYTSGDAIYSYSYNSRS